MSPLRAFSELSTAPLGLHQRMVLAQVSSCNLVVERHMIREGRHQIWTLLIFLGLSTDTWLMTLITFYWILWSQKASKRPLSWDFVAYAFKVKNELPWSDHDWQLTDTLQEVNEFKIPAGGDPQASLSFIKLDYASCSEHTHTHTCTHQHQTNTTYHS